MDIPNIPTDSLYKFVAIFGLVILIAGNYFYITTTNQFVSDTFTTSEKLGTLKIESDFLLEKVTNEIETGTDIAEMQKEKYELKNLLIELENVRGKMDKFEIMKLDVKNARVVSWLSLGIGMHFIIYGFWLWYSKIQYYQDLIIRHKAGDIDIKNRKLFEIFIGILSILIWIFVFYKIIF